MNNIKNKLQAYLENSPVGTQKILFLSEGVNPEWSDSQKVFDKAVDQILLHTGIMNDEEPYAFIGVHSLSVISFRRKSIGFMITNQRVLSQYRYSVVGTAPKAQSTKFSYSQDADTLCTKVWDHFVENEMLDIDDEILDSMHRALQDVLDIVLSDLKAEGVLKVEDQSSITLADRISELGLDSYFFSPQEGNKNLQKFITKYEVSDPISGMIFKSIIGGNIGLVITRDGIVSREHLEPVVRSTWSDIKASPATAGEKETQILVGEQLHFIPDHYASVTPAVIKLINELAEGTISLNA